MSEIYNENNNHKIKLQICDKLFWGFTVEVDKSNINNYLPNNLQWIFDYTKLQLIRHLSTANFLNLLEEAKKITFHIHYNPEDSDTIFLCTECKKV